MFLCIPQSLSNIASIDRCEHQRAGASVLERLGGELDRFHHRAATGSRHHARRPRHFFEPQNLRISEFVNPIPLAQIPTRVSAFQYRKAI
jgi:hypothetical protein